MKPFCKSRTHHLALMALMIPLLATPAMADNKGHDPARYPYSRDHKDNHRDDRRHDDRRDNHRDDRRSDRRHDDRRDHDHRNRHHTRVEVNPTIVIRGAYAPFFSSGYHVRDYDRYDGRRIIRVAPAQTYASYHHGRKRIQPQSCRRVYFVTRKGKGDAIHSEVVCHDRFGDTYVVPRTRQFEGWRR